MGKLEFLVQVFFGHGPLKDKILGLLTNDLLVVPFHVGIPNVTKKEHFTYRTRPPPWQLICDCLLLAARKVYPHT